MERPSGHFFAHSLEQPSGKVMGPTACLLCLRLASQSLALQSCTSGKHAVISSQSCHFTVALSNLVEDQTTDRLIQDIVIQTKWSYRTIQHSKTCISTVSRETPSNGETQCMHNFDTVRKWVDEGQDSRNDARAATA